MSGVTGAGSVSQNVVQMSDSVAHRNQVAIFDLMWFVPLTVLVALDCYDLLPSVPGLPVSLSALGVLLLSAGALLVLRRLRRRSPGSMANLSGLILWMIILMSAFAIVSSLVIELWLTRASLQ